MEYIAKKECYVGKVHCKKGDKVDISDDVAKAYPKKYFEELFELVRNETHQVQNE